MSGDNWAAVFVNRDTLATAFDQISHDDLRAFRYNALKNDPTRTYPGILNLVEDEWDRLSVHIICAVGSEILATSRLVPAHEGRLPISENTNDLVSPMDGDTEMSRVIVSPQHRGGAGFFAMLSGFRAAYEGGDTGTLLTFKRDEVIYTEVFLGGPSMLNRRTYERLGFESLGNRYLDANYDWTCESMWMPKERREIFVDRIRTLERRYLRHVAAR